MLTLKHFDDSIAQIRRPTGDPSLDRITGLIADVVDSFRDGHSQLIEELLTMYQSAAEHNVDVSRRAIYDLAMRLKG